MLSTIAGSHYRSTGTTEPSAPCRGGATLRSSARRCPQRSLMVVLRRDHFGMAIGCELLRQQLIELPLALSRKCSGICGNRAAVSRRARYLMGARRRLQQHSGRFVARDLASALHRDGGPRPADDRENWILCRLVWPTSAAGGRKEIVNRAWIRNSRHAYSLKTRRGGCLGVRQRGFGLSTLAVLREALGARVSFCRRERILHEGGEQASSRRHARARDRRLSMKVGE